MKKRGSQICFGFRWAQQWEERWALGALSDEKMRGGFWRVNCLEYKGLLTRPRWGYLGCQLHAVMLWASCSCWLLETMPVCRGAVWNKSPRSEPCRGSAFLHRNRSVVRPVTRIPNYPTLKNCITRNGFLYTKMQSVACSFKLTSILLRLLCLSFKDICRSRRRFKNSIAHFFNNILCRLFTYMDYESVLKNMNLNS